MDGIAIIVNPSNPINALSKAQIKEIYTKLNKTKPAGLNTKLTFPLYSLNINRL